MRRVAGAVVRFLRGLAAAVLVVLALASLLPAACLLGLAYALWPEVAWRYTAPAPRAAGEHEHPVVTALRLMRERKAS